MTLLLTVLGAMLCSLMVSSQVQPQADFDLQGMAGKWYLLGYATNADWFVDARNNMAVSTAVFIPTADGDLDMTKTCLNPDGSCLSVTNNLIQTDVPGKFKYTSQWGSKIMIVADVKYDEYALTHTVTIGDPNVTTKLYVRAEGFSVGMLGKFTRFSLDNGILFKNIAILPNNGECPAA